MREGELEGKIAVVTGASGGIGRLIVERLAKHGAVIAALDKDKDELVTGIKKMQERGYPVTAFPSDVTDPMIVEEVISTVESELGPIDILVNVAGVLRLDLIDNLDQVDWDTSFAVNATGVFHMSKIVSKQMIPRKRGSIITVSSNASHIPRIGMAAYGASKAAATMFTKCLGLELAKHKIRCNVISPGSTDTNMLRKLWSSEEGEIETIDGQSEVYRVGIPLGKIGTPSDIANAVLFFATDQSSQITMHDMVIDGGATLGV